MTLAAAALIGLLITMVALLVKFQQRASAIFAGAMLVTFACGWVTETNLLRNAANPGLMTLVMLILVSYALEKTALLRRISRFLFSKSESASLIKTMGVSALASSVLNNTAVVAALLNAVRNNRYVPSSRLLIPLSFAAIMGGTLTLIGTSTNLIVNSMFTDTGHAGFRFFDFTLVGLVVLLGGSSVLLITARWLPRQTDEKSESAQYYLEAQLSESSPLVGKHIDEAGLRHLEDLFLTEIIRADGLEVIRPVARYDVLQAGDKLLFTGDVSKVKVLSQFPGLSLFADDNGLATHELTEVIIKEESVLIGKALKQTGFRARFDAAVVAIRRDGHRLTGKLGDVQLQPGDFLLLATGPDFSARTNLSKNFYVLSGMQPDNVLSGWRERITIWGFVVMIAGTVITGSSLFMGVLFLLALLLVTGCLNVNEIKRRFPIEIWLIVTSALCIANALESTGLASALTNFASTSLEGYTPYVAFIGVYLLTYILTELVTNNAAAALMFPVGYSLAVGMGIDPFPMVMGIAFAASASFVTPYGYQTNLMVFNASSYRLKHFVLIGAPVAITYNALSILAVPFFFPFYS
ncbi:MAG: SLC13 family permease [Idiomarina sp.]